MDSQVFFTVFGFVLALCVRALWVWLIRQR